MGKYWDGVTQIAKKQEEKGLKEYGMTLDENKELSMVVRLEMLEEELVDALNYIEHIKAKMYEMYNNGYADGSLAVSQEICRKYASTCLERAKKEGTTVEYQLWSVLDEMK